MIRFAGDLRRVTGGQIPRGICSTEREAFQRYPRETC